MFYVVLVDQVNLLPNVLCAPSGAGKVAPTQCSVLTQWIWQSIWFQMFYVVLVDQVINLLSNVLCASSGAGKVAPTQINFCVEPQEQVRLFLVKVLCGPSEAVKVSSPLCFVWTHWSR